MIIVLDRRSTELRASVDGGELEPVGDLAAFVARFERDRPRWVWDDTSWWYPQLLAARVRVDRCFDLRLCHSILRLSELTAGSQLATAPIGPWDRPALEPRPRDDALFELDDADAEPLPDPVAEFQAQRAAVAASSEPGRIDRLLAVESAGALIAAEMQYAGLRGAPGSMTRSSRAFSGRARERASDRHGSRRCWSAFGPRSTSPTSTPTLLSNCSSTCGTRDWPSPRPRSGSSPTSSIP